MLKAILFALFGKTISLSPLSQLHIVFIDLKIEFNAPANALESPENQRILGPVFQDLPFKDLFIPKAIDDYNHHMQDVDPADQLRVEFTCHRKQNYRTWWPLFYFLIDVACVNAYLLWKWSSIAHTASAKRTHNSHKDFMSALCDQLLHSNDEIEEEEQSPVDAHRSTLFSP